MLLGFWLSTAMAQEIVIELDQTQVESFNLDLGDAETAIRDEVAVQLGLFDQGALLSAMSNANVASGRGQGVDYATNVEEWVFGVSAGTAASPALNDAGFGGIGLSAQGSLMGGINLGIFSQSEEPNFLNRVVVMFHGGSLQLPANSEGLFAASMFNIGGHVQAKIVPGVEDVIGGWGGLDLTVGYERSQYRVDLRQGVPLSQVYQGVRLSWDAEGAYELVNAVDAIPIDISTNARLSLLTVYVGAGVDFDFGGAWSVASLQGPVRAARGDRDEQIGTVGVFLDGNGAVNPMSVRGFAGAQLNLSVLKLVGHGALSMDGSIAGHLAVRLAK